MSAKARIFLLLAIANLIWAPVNLMIVTATSSGLSPAGVGLLRWNAVALLMTLALQFRGFRRSTGFMSVPLHVKLKALAIGMLMSAPAHLMYYASLGRTSTVEGNVLTTSSPLWVALFAAVLLRERVTHRRWTAIFIGTAGAYVVSVGFQLPILSSEHTYANVLYLSGVAIESLAFIVSLPLIRRYTGAGVLQFQMVGLGLAFLVIWALRLPGVPMELSLSPAALLAVAYLVVLAGFVAFNIWFQVAEKAPASFMVITLMSQPPIAATVAWFWRAEPLTTQTLVGSAVIAAALLLSATEKLAVAGGEVTENKREQNRDRQPGEAPVASGGGATAHRLAGEEAD